jgi:hypothetical protein
MAKELEKKAGLEPTKGTDPNKTVVSPTQPANAGTLNPPAVTNEVREASKESPDLRTRSQALDTGTTPPKTDEAPPEAYRDPNSVGPNPDVEAYPNQKPNESRVFNATPPPAFGTNTHQVYPEAAMGVTPTDPDLREQNEGDTAEQQRRMRVRRDTRDQSETVNLRQRPSRLERRMREFGEAATKVGSPQPLPKFEGGQQNLEANQQYKVRSDQLGSGWWLAKYNTHPTLTVEGTVKDIFGADYGDRALYGHYLFIEYNDRRNSMPKGHPIRTSDDQIYVANVQGRRVLVHGFEVEPLDEQKQNQNPARNAQGGETVRETVR